MLNVHSRPPHETFPSVKKKKRARRQLISLLAQYMACPSLTYKWCWSLSWTDHIVKPLSVRVSFSPLHSDIMEWWACILLSSEGPADFKCSLNVDQAKPWLGGSVGWSIVLSTKMLQVDPPSRHITRLQVRSQVCVCTESGGDLSMDVSLSHQCFSLLLPPPKVNRYILGWGLKKMLTKCLTRANLG